MCAEALQIRLRKINHGAWFGGRRRDRALYIRRNEIEDPRLRNPMRAQSLVLAIALSLAASAASAGNGLPPASSKPDPAAEFERKERRNERRKPWDCHRDVRRHRIDGVMVLHRHIGDRCQVRVVRKMNSF